MTRYYAGPKTKTPAKNKRPPKPQEKISYNIDDFPGCCGVRVVWDFSLSEFRWVEFYESWENVNDERGDTNDTKDSFITSMKEQNTALMASLNETQIKAGIRKYLLAAGFKHLRSFINPNTGNKVFVYYRPPAELPKKKKWL